LESTSSSNSPVWTKNIVPGHSKRDFEYLGELGRGANGVAFKVRSLLIPGQTFVIKEVRLSAMKPSERQRSMREAQLLQQLSHPSLVACHHAFVEDSLLFLVLEYAEGGDLGSFIRSLRQQRKQLDISSVSSLSEAILTCTQRELWRMSWELCMGVAYLHSHHVVHRDLKASNIFLTAQNSIKVGPPRCRGECESVT